MFDVLCGCHNDSCVCAGVSTAVIGIHQIRDGPKKGFTFLNQKTPSIIASSSSSKIYVNMIKVLKADIIVMYE